MKNRQIRIWEIIGFILISIIGSSFHFCYEWSGNLKPIALFCAVNESVWEHVKMGFWPAMFYAAIEYFTFGKTNKNFFVAKTAALYSIPIIIIGVFYFLEAILEHHSFWIDIALFIASILISQYISYRMIISRRNYSTWNKIAIPALLLLTLAFSLFTFNPPKLEIFKDPNTDNYGITK